MKIKLTNKMKLILKIIKTVLYYFINKLFYIIGKFCKNVGYLVTPSSSDTNLQNFSIER